MLILEWRRAIEKSTYKPFLFPQWQSKIFYKVQEICSQLVKTRSMLLHHSKSSTTGYKSREYRKTKEIYSHVIVHYN